MRDRILNAADDCQDNDFRIVIRIQQDLWREGAQAAVGSKDSPVPKNGDNLEDGGGAPEERFIEPAVGRGATQAYRAGKWGRYVRAPDFYFDIMKRFGGRFVRMGEIVTIRRGITSGCDAFFMPKDVSGRMLRQHRTDRSFREHTGVARNRVESGSLRILEAGDGSFHPIEAEYVSPEVHSPMKVTRPVVRSGDVDRVVLLVGEGAGGASASNKWVRQYLRYGMKATFSTAKSRGRPVPERPTCAARQPWYDLTRSARPGFAFWPKSQQYRHIIPANPDGIACNCNLYNLESDTLDAAERIALVSSLNSTIVGFFKTFYGRFAGTEGNLKTEGVDLNLRDIPDRSPLRSNEPALSRYQGS